MIKGIFLLKRCVNDYVESACVHMVCAGEATSSHKLWDAQGESVSTCAQLTVEHFGENVVAGNVGVRRTMWSLAGCAALRSKAKRRVHRRRPARCGRFEKCTCMRMSCVIDGVKMQGDGVRRTCVGIRTSHHRC